MAFAKHFSDAAETPMSRVVDILLGKWLDARSLRKLAGTCRTMTFWLDEEFMKRWAKRRFFTSFSSIESVFDQLVGEDYTVGPRSSAEAIAAFLEQQAREAFETLSARAL